MTSKKKSGISIFARILIIFICVNIATSGILMTIAFTFHRQSIEHRTKETVTQQLEILRDNFENDYRHNLKKTLEMLVSSSILDDYIAVSDYEKKILSKKIEQQFIQTIKTHKTYHCIRFIDADGNINIGVTGKLRNKEAVNLKQIKSDDLASFSESLSLRAGVKLFQKLESIPLLLSGGYMEWFMPSREIQLEGPFIDENGKLSLLAGVSKLDLDIGAFGGVLMIHQKLEKFFNGLRDVKFFDENLIWVFDAKGRLLKSPEKEENRLMPDHYLSATFQGTPRLLDVKEGLVVYQDFSIIPGKPFIRVVISMPSALLVKDFFPAIRFFSLVLVSSLVLVLLVSLYVSRYLSKPIIELAKAANRMAEGDLNAKVRLKTTGEVQMLVNSFNQMTEELQQKTILLVEREQRYRNLTGNLPGIVYRLDLRSDKNILFFNDMLYPMTGHNDEDLKRGKLCALESMIIQQDSNKVILKIIDAIKKKQPFQIEYRVKHKEGDRRYFLERGRPIYQSNGEPKYVDGVILDVTEREEAEDERKELESKLLRAQKLEAVGTLAGGVAHDLNNILSGVVSYPELLLLGIPEESPLRKPLLTIKKSGEKAAAVVNDLLTLARRGVVVTEIVNLNNIISDYLESLEYSKMLSYHSEVRFDTDLDLNLLNIMASPIHITKVVMNLASNAVEAISGIGTVRISTECRYLDRPVSNYENVNEGDYVVLTVSDSGEGISDQDIEKIFEPFYTKKKMGRSGTGLGLPVIWGVIKDHNGYIDVKSDRGIGSTFTVFFPVARGNSAKAESKSALDSFMGKGELILVIDDVEEQRQVASAILETLRYSVVSVSSGEDAVEYITNNSADLLVLDMIMDPGIDGLDTYKKILNLHPGQKAILASGYSETDRVKEAQRLGAGTYIKKPYTLEKIGTAIKRELEKQ
ncbi:ATP-binding protein [Desulfococcaceae bacterium HSG9]|nr:ATP-binding protein [Desulfococcaceae bacterium HSG9]